MKKPHGLLLLLVLSSLLLAGALLASCAPDTSAPERRTPTEETTPVELGETVSEVASAPQIGLDPVAFTDEACLNCHTNEQVLRALAVEEQPVEALTDAVRQHSTIAQMEAWEKVFIDAKAYAQDVHALINCTACHGGEAVGSMDAHQGLMADPSADPIAGCGTCHPNIAPFAATSLHFTLQGFDTALTARSSPEHFGTLEEMQALQCNDCHASCGDCHISLSDTAGGGLLQGHVFAGSPPPNQTCAGCHGSPVGVEYYGLTEGLPADVHFREADLDCTTCHSGEQMHGMGVFADKTHRYDGAPAPSCIDCHKDDIGIGSGNLQHEIHGTEIVSCQVCHSVAYTNCTSCHVDRTDEGVPFYSVEAHETAFLIGRNPLISNDRPWRYVPVRRVPIEIDSFSAYGPDLLANFLNRPTWSYATPHNIQRNTPQTENCISCHGNDEYFLTPDKVAEAELAGANLRVIVDEAPPIPANAANLIRQVTERINAMLGAAETSTGEVAPDVDMAEDAEGDADLPDGEAQPTEEPGTDASSSDSGDSTPPIDADEADTTAPAPGDSAASEAEPTSAADSDFSYWGNLTGQ
jgi:hypothetical protein